MGKQCDHGVKKSGNWLKLNISSFFMSSVLLLVGDGLVQQCGNGYRLCAPPNKTMASGHCPMCYSHPGSKFISAMKEVEMSMFSSLSKGSCC